MNGMPLAGKFMGTKAIIFDIDGVLADSRQAVAYNTKELMREFGFSVEGARVDEMSTAHSADSVLISLAPALANDRALLKKMLARLSALTTENISLVKPTVLCAAVPVLSEKYLLAAATNRKSSAALVLSHLGISEYFKAVLTSADAPAKPDPKMLLLSLERMGVRAEDAIFVGDNEEDIAAGKAAGVDTLKVDGKNAESCRLFLRRFL